MAPKPKLTDAQILQAKARLESDPDLKQAAVAAELGVDPASLSRALAKLRAPTPAGDMQMIPLLNLTPSTLNPRRSFDEDALAELAESIANSGLLQNLVVRRDSDQPAIYWIVAGERRYRALQLLAKDGRWDAPVPCRVIVADDATHLATALLENLQRQDVPAVEEAEAFSRLHALDPETWSTGAIAARIGKSMRYVQQRIAIAEKLTPAAKLLLSRGLLNIEGARLLAGQDADAQTYILDQYELADCTDEDFDWSGCEPIPPEDITGILNFRKNTRPTQPAVQPSPGMAEASHDFADDGAEDDEDHLPQPAEQARTEKPEPAAPPVTKAHIYHAHRRKSAALQEAVRTNTHAALALLCFALLIDNGVVTIRPGFIAPDERPAQPAAIEALIAPYFKAAKIKSEHGWVEEKQKIALWHSLFSRSESELLELLASLVARQTHTPAGYDARAEDTALALAIATSLDLAGDEAAHGLDEITAEDLAGIRKTALVSVGHRMAAPIGATMKTAELIGAVVDQAETTSYVLPTFRFLEEKAMKKAMKELDA